MRTEKTTDGWVCYWCGEVRAWSTHAGLYYMGQGEIGFVCKRCCRSRSHEMPDAAQKALRQEKGNDD